MGAVKKILTLVALLILISAMGALYIYSRLTAGPKRLPSTANHFGFTAHTQNQTCLRCHAPGAKIAPMHADHPIKGKPPDNTLCVECHMAPNG